MNKKIHELWKLQKELFPLFRTYLGKDYNQSLKIINKIIPIKKIFFKSGKKIGSWTVPKEWIVKDAWIKNGKKKILDYYKNKFCLWTYSISFKKKIPFKILIDHLKFNKNIPNATLLHTTIYKKNWGFSIPYKEFKKIKKKANLEINIETVFRKSNLTVGEIFLEGKSRKEIIFDSVLSCPSLANNLSAVTIMVYFAKYIKNIKNINYSYRFLFTPETIGPLAYYYKDKNKTNIVGGLNLNNLAYKDIFHYTRSRVGRSIVDKAIDYINCKKKYKLNINNYSVVSGRSGNEKAYNSLGLEYPVGSLTRSLAGSYKEYDTDKDNLEFINKNKFLESYNFLIDLFYVIENEKLVKNNFKGEPFLTGYGLFSDIEDIKNRKLYDYLISFADGKKTLLDFSIEQKFDLNILSTVASKLLNKKILKNKPYKII